MVFYAGAITGAGIMLLVMSLCIAAGRADEWGERKKTMKSEWKVSANPISTENGYEYIYQVYRIRDTDAIDHSGNRETFDSYSVREIAEMKADELNRREG